MSGAAGARRSTPADRTPPPLTPPPLATAGLKGLCPRCRAPRLFDGVIRFASHCRACGLDFDAYNVGDGPAAFLTLIIGTMVVTAAITVELAFSPPWWVHLIWGPVSLAAVVGSLRVAKGLLIAAEYRNRPREGRIVEAGARNADDE